MTVENRIGEGRLLALRGKQLGAGIFRCRLVADHPVGFEFAVADEPPRVHDALGNPLPVEVRNLFKEVVVLERRRATAADRPLRLVVGYGVALPGRQCVLRGLVVLLLRHLNNSNTK